MQRPSPKSYQQPAGNQHECTHGSKVLSRQHHTLGFEGEQKAKLYQHILAFNQNHCMGDYNSWYANLTMPHLVMHAIWLTHGSKEQPCVYSTLFQCHFKLLLICKGLQSNANIAAGQWWRLITPAFLHLNLLHLALNSMALNNMGPMLERESGLGRFVAVYAISAVTGVAAHCLLPHYSQGSSSKTKEYFCTSVNPCTDVFVH